MQTECGQSLVILGGQILAGLAGIRDMREGERGAKGESQCQPSAPGWVEAVGSRRQSLGKGVVVQNEHIMGRCIYGHWEEMFSGH